MKTVGVVLALVCLLNTQVFTQVNSPQVNFKFGKGLQIVAPDSSIALKIGFRFQSLLTSERNLAESETWNSNFLIRRSRLKFDGWALSPRLAYKVELGLSNRDLSSSKDFAQTSQAPKIILDAVVKYKLNDHLSLWFGQTKLPGNRERVISSQKLQFVDRSLVNSIFNLDREMGIQLHSRFQPSEKFILKPAFSWSFGEGRNITSNNFGGYHYTGRLELLPLGEFTGGGDYFESDLNREPIPKIAFGATLSLNRGTSRQSHTGRFLQDSLGNYLLHDLNTFLLDFIFKYRGFSVMGEIADKKITGLPSAIENTLLQDPILDAHGNGYYTGKGYNLQFSYLFKNNFEVATRITEVVPDSPASFTRINEYTLGASKYFYGHNLKLQSDISLIDKAKTDSNRLRFRLQMEFAF